MIDDQILNDLWAVMEDNPDNPDQLRVIADRYQEINEGFSKIADCFRFLGEFGRYPLHFGKDYFVWNAVNEGNYYPHDRLPRLLCPDVGISGYSARYVFEVVAHRYHYLDDTQQVWKYLKYYYESLIKLGDFIASDSQGRAIKVKPGDAKYLGICRQVLNDKRTIVSIPNRAEMGPIDRGNL